eukprot:gene14880-31587_t
MTPSSPRRALLATAAVLALGTLQAPAALAQAAGAYPAKISSATKQALTDPAVRKRVEDTGSLIVANTPAEFTAQIKADGRQAEAQAGVMDPALASTSEDLAGAFVDALWLEEGLSRNTLDAYRRDL